MKEVKGEEKRSVEEQESAPKQRIRAQFCQI